MKKTTQKIALHNGLLMPLVGFGTYKITDPKVGIPAITEAINTGYLLLDSAEYYKNHHLIAQAIKNSNKNREDLFLTSKIWPNSNDPKIISQRIEKVLAELETDYLDLLLVHWPKPYGLATYKVLEDFYLAGRVRAIGVSNFNESQLQELLENCRIKPMVNQIELHPDTPRTALVHFAQKQKIVITSWQTLMRGEIGNLPHIQKLAQKYKVDAAAIALNWAIQQNIAVIPKSITSSRIQNNYANLDSFNLSQEEINQITALASELHPRMDSETFLAQDFL